MLYLWLLHISLREASSVKHRLGGALGLWLCDASAVLVEPCAGKDTSRVRKHASALMQPEYGQAISCTFSERDDWQITKTLLVPTEGPGTSLSRCALTWGHDGSLRDGRRDLDNILAADGPGHVTIRPGCGSLGDSRTLPNILANHRHIAYASFRSA